MCTHGRNAGSKGLDVYPTAPREDAKALMCTPAKGKGLQTSDVKLLSNPPAILEPPKPPMIDLPPPPISD